LHHPLHRQPPSVRVRCPAFLRSWSSASCRGTDEAHASSALKLAGRQRGSDSKANRVCACWTTAPARLSQSPRSPAPRRPADPTASDAGAT